MDEKRQGDEREQWVSQSCSSCDVGSTETGGTQGRVPILKML